ncbi:Hypothetical protein Minf_2449 [Methylacidiphilum infernorum V4]|uniref:Uncharacterized protein n=1 Tax=Methylacidiphilum infernorum (isolate V4) TaxID=481448 RepID=B3E126_METI4|nr:Hypothetical protein Minf_2449 [Methylacidiphilum infernorum V4]
MSISPMKNSSIEAVVTTVYPLEINFLPFFIPPVCLRAVSFFCFLSFIKFFYVFDLSCSKK